MKHLGKDQIPFGQTNTEVLEGRWLPASAGIDIHKETLTATVLIPDFETQTITKYAQKFNTDHYSLTSLASWLIQFKPLGLTRYGIEATSTYYRPVEYALSGLFQQVLINPYLLKERRKTDAKDSYTIAYVVLTGLFQPNTVTPEIQQVLKTLTRRQRKAIYKRTAASNAIETTLTNYNILLGQEITMLSVSGQAILETIIAGATIPEVAAVSAAYYSQTTIPERKEKYQRILISLRHLPYLPESVRFTIQKLYEDAKHHDKQVGGYDAQITIALDKYKVIDEGTGEIIITAEEAIQLLQTVPAVNDRFINIFIAECGIDMRRFPTAGHLVSFCGFNPEKKVSANKVTSAGTLPGNKHIHSITTQICQAMLQQAKADNPLVRWGRQYRARNGNSSGAHNMAVSAIAKRLILSIWHMLSKKEPYNTEKYDYAMREHEAQKEVKKLLNHTRNVVNAIHIVDLNEHTKANALDIMTSIAKAVGLDTAQLQIVPHQPDKPITQLGLPKRIITALEIHEIRMTSQLVYLWASQSLNNLKGIGQITFTTILDHLINHNYIKPTHATPEPPQPTASQPSPRGSLAPHI